MNVQRVVRIACGVGVVHFGIATLLWLLFTVFTVLMAVRFGAANNIRWSSLLQSLPAFAFLAGFYLAFRHSRQRPKVAAVACTALFLAAAALFCYDTTHDRYQMRSLFGPGGCTHFYNTWFWWEYDR